MRALIAAPILALSLLGGCAQEQFLLAEQQPGPHLGTSPAGYTNNSARSATTKVVPLAIDKSFSEPQKAEIMAAIGEWNHVMNGAVRFDVLPQGSIAPNGWTISASKEFFTFSRQTNPEPLVSDLRTGKDSGVIVVYVNRVDDPQTHDTRRVGLHGLMLRSLGEALGGGIGTSLYRAHVEDCIDRRVAIAVGDAQRIPPERLNWCERSSVAAR